MNVSLRNTKGVELSGSDRDGDVSSVRGLRNLHPLPFHTIFYYTH